MQLTEQQAHAMQHPVAEAVARLAEAGVATSRLVEFVAQTRRFLFTRKARFIDLAEVWPLGVLLVTTTGRLHSAGETTRAVAPGYPGHTSLERERRREFTRIAHESGYAEGEVLYFNSPSIPLEAGACVPDGGAVIFESSEPRVRWNRSLPASSAVPFAQYLAEQVELKIDQATRQ